MLRRKMLDELTAWRKAKSAECLLIKGARQVGKSFIVDAFGRKEYRSYIPIDFIADGGAKEIFDGSLDAATIYQRISLHVPGVRFIKGDTLIFLDEIQECPRARTALKYLAQDDSYDVIASGSLLGIQYRETEGSASVPVGYERQIRMHPLDFEEYLWAKGYGDDALEVLSGYCERLEAVPTGLNDLFMGFLREYIAVGGMPSVVQAFVDSNDFGLVRAEQLRLHESYLDDIAKYAGGTERVKARACYESLPRQLAKENTKFQYAVVEKKGTARKFESAVDWLVGSNMVLLCQAVATPAFPLVSYEDMGRFRLYANDTGLLLAMMPRQMLEAVIVNSLKGPMKGGLYENFVAGMLAKAGRPLHYWMSRNGKHEIEFLLDGPGASVSPVEVKASRGATASLNEQLARSDVQVGYKLIDGNIGRDGKKVTLPLYMAAFLFNQSRQGGVT